MMKTIALALCALVIGVGIGCPAARAQIQEDTTVVLSDPARLELPLLADVDEDRRIVGSQPLVRLGRADLEDKLPVTRHAPRIIGHA